MRIIRSSHEFEQEISKPYFYAFDEISFRFTCHPFPPFFLAPIQIDGFFNSGSRQFIFEQEKQKEYAFGYYIYYSYYGYGYCSKPLSTESTRKGRLFKLRASSNT